MALTSVKKSDQKKRKLAAASNGSEGDLMIHSKKKQKKSINVKIPTETKRALNTSTTEINSIKNNKHKISTPNKTLKSPKKNKKNIYKLNLKDKMEESDKGINSDSESDLPVQSAALSHDSSSDDSDDHYQPPTIKTKQKVHKSYTGTVGVTKSLPSSVNIKNSTLKRGIMALKKIPSTDAGNSTNLNSSTATNQELGDNGKTQPLDDKKKKKKLSRKEYEQQAVNFEKQLREIEASRLNDAAQAPQNELGYQELLQANPKCSATWIQYASFLIGEGNIPRGEAVLREALTRVPAEEQNERLNIWLVRLRVQVMHGESEQQTDELLAEAVASADDYAILSNMADIYQQNGYLEKAESLHRRLNKKYYRDTNAWAACGAFYYTTQRPADARQVLVRALQAYDVTSTKNKKKGVDVTSRFAQLELLHGCPNKADAMFESILASYPKRLDIWNVYADILTKRGQVDPARKVLNRLCSQPLRLNKKRAAFEKLKRFEEQHNGDIGSVNARIQAYVDSIEREEGLN